MNHELNNKIEYLISKFENGKERYRKSAMFNQVINSLARGADPIHIIDQTLKANDIVHEEFKNYATNDTRPLVVSRGKLSREEFIEVAKTVELCITHDYDYKGLISQGYFTERFNTAWKKYLRSSIGVPEEGINNR